MRNLNGGQITLSAITPPGVACLSDLVLENVGYSPPRIAGLLSEIMESWGLGGRCGHERKNRLVGMHVSRNKTRRAERRSVLRGTRMPADAIVDNFDYGVSVAEIADQFEVPPDRVEAILAYAKSHRVAHPV